MGYHFCKYCENDGWPKTRFDPKSSGDCFIGVDGRGFQFPDMVSHYVHDHQWQPPQEFIDMVMNNDLETIAKNGAKFIRLCDHEDIMVGYLSNQFKTGTVPHGFVERLEKLKELCDKHGSRAQSKSIQV